MTFAELFKEHRIDKRKEVFYLLDPELGGILSLNLEFEKGEVEFQLFDCLEAAEVFRAWLATSDYGEAINAKNLVVKSMPFADFIKECEYDA